MDQRQSSRVLCALAVLGATSWMACATAPSGPAYRPTDRPVREIPQSQAAQAMAKEVAAYATQPGAPGLLHRPFVDGLSDEDRERVTYLEGLDDVAQVLASMVAERNQLPAKTLEQWLFWRFGVPFNAIGVRADVVTGGGAGPYLDDKTAGHLEVLQQIQGPVAFGIGRAQAAGQRTAQVIVFASHPVSLGDVPRSVQPTETVKLSGRVREQAEDLALLVDDGEGIRRTPLEAGDDGSFEATFDAPQKPGQYFVELTALVPGEGNASERWRRSLVMFPLHVGPAPTEPSAFILDPPENPATDEEVAALLLELYQKARAEAGVAAFVPHEGLQKQAQRLADEGARAGRPASGRDLPRRMAARGFPTRHLGHMAGIFESAQEQVWHDLLSPSMRKVLLDKRTSHVGLAIHKDTRGLYAMSFVYAQPVGQLDPAKERDKLFDAFNRRRQKSGLIPFAEDRKLDAALAEHAARVCAGELLPDDFDELDAPLNQAARGRYKSVRTNWIIANVVLPSDVWRYREIVKSDATTLAIATCQGKLPKRPGSEYVLVLEATRH